MAPSAFDPRLYLVTGDIGAERRLVDVVVEAVAGGVTAVQLREKGADRTRLRVAYAQLHRELADTGVPVLLNDDVDVADAIGADGVHVGPDDQPPHKARSRLGESAVIGWSIHDYAQLDERDHVVACDYLAASPVWPTPTKPNTTAPFGLEGIAVLRRKVPDRPLLAIGGINASNAASVIEAGADGIAVVSAICAAADPRAAARELRTVVDEALAARTDGNV